jgi:hypothetical protein
MKLPAQNRYDYSVIHERPDYSWPDGKRLAFCVVLNVEHYAFLKGWGWDPAKIGEPQTQRNYAWRDYGNRVGIWRIFDLLDALKLPAAHNLNALVCENYPQVIARMKERGDEIVAHGRTNSERQRELWEEDERRLIDDVTDIIRKHMGKAPTGWMGPAASESATTPDMLKEAGYDYVMDWPCDDQPIWLRTRSGPILSVPYPAEVNDSAALIHRQQSMEEFAAVIVNHFDEMVEQSAKQPLVCTISLHPFVVGQPFRLRLLRQALQHCAEHPLRDRVWFTTPGQIAAYCKALEPGVIPGS